MGAAVVLGVVFVFLVVILAGLLRGLDWEELRRCGSGPASLSGVRAIVGGGFLVGLAYGLLVGQAGGTETWRWLSRGVVDGLVVACAGAFYVGYQQRKRLRDRPADPPVEASQVTLPAPAPESPPAVEPPAAPPAPSEGVPPASTVEPRAEDTGGGERTT